MDIEVSTPALLFPAVSLLMLAYTNRFLSLANLIRELHGRYKKAPDEIILKQIANLRRRIHLIRDMQGAGVLSLLGCVACMFVLFAGHPLAGKILFGASLVLLMVSLGLSIVEIRMSILALDLHLGDLEKQTGPGSDFEKRAPTPGRTSEPGAEDGPPGQADRSGMGP